MATLKWRGKELLEQLKSDIADACVEIGHRGEELAKDNLTPGHGFDTGTMRRGLHAAAPDYDYAQDNVDPAPGTPERGGRPFKPLVTHDKVSFALGAGQDYSMFQHEGTKFIQAAKFITSIIPVWGRWALDILRKHTRH